MYRLVSWGVRRLILSPQSFPTFAPALSALKAYYPIMRGTLAVCDDHGQSPMTALVAPPSWAIVDGINPDSWGAGQLSIKEYAATGALLDDFLTDGPDVVDQGHILGADTDGTVSVWLDTDGDGIAETLASGDWQFRVGGVGDFDAPGAPFRTYSLAAGTLVEAQDADGELPTLSCYTGDVTPYPVPLTRAGVVSERTGRFLIPEAQPQDGPFGGADALVIQKEYGPYTYRQGVTPFKVGNVIPDQQANQETGTQRPYRLGNVYLARPYTALRDDDGHTPGYFLVGVRGGVNASSRTRKTVIDGTYQTAVYTDTAQADAAQLATADLFAIPYQVGSGGVVAPGLRKMCVCDSAWGGTFPARPVTSDIADAGDALVSTPFVSWALSYWVQAVYVYRDAQGAETRYYSEQTNGTLNLVPWLSYPVMPTRYQKSAPGVFLKGAIQGLHGGWGWDAQNSVATYVDHGLYFEDEGLIADFPPMPGAVAHHFLTTRQANGGNNAPAPYADVFAYYLATGQQVASPRYQMNDTTNPTPLCPLGVGGEVSIDVTCYPVIGKYQNGGTVPYDVDSIEYINAQGTTSQCGQTPITRLIWCQHRIPGAFANMAQYKSVGANVFRWDNSNCTGDGHDDHLDTYATPADIVDYECPLSVTTFYMGTDAAGGQMYGGVAPLTATVKAASMGATGCGASLGAEPPQAAPPTAYKGRAVIWYTHWYTSLKASTLKAPSDYDNAGSATFMQAQGTDKYGATLNAGSASFMGTQADGPGVPTDNAGTATFLGYVPQDADIDPHNPPTLLQGTGRAADDPSDVVAHFGPVTVYKRPQIKP